MSSDKTVIGECMEWRGALHDSGYGIVMVDGKQKRAHRLIWEAIYGPIPDGMIVCHHCDNRKCCRPEHLFLGTHKDNAADRNAKGRQAKGEQHGRWVDGRRARRPEVREMVRARRGAALIARVEARRAAYRASRRERP